MKQWARAVAGLAGVRGDGAWRQIGRGTWETRRGGGGDDANALREYITSEAALIGSRTGS